MERVGEQWNRQPGKTPALVEVGVNVFLKAHSLQGFGLETFGPAALGSVAERALGTGAQNALEGMADPGIIDILESERADLERAKDLLMRIESGEIGDKQIKGAVEKEIRR